MPRQQRDELQFGSDSFLDVVANIVGILIILIVVVGVRVSRAPAMARSVDEHVPPAAALPAPLPEPDPEPALPLPELPPLPAALPPAQLVEQTRQLDRQNQELAAQLQSLAGRSASLHERQQDERLAAAARQEKISEQAQRLRTERAHLAELETALDQQRQEIQRLQSESSALLESKPEVRQLAHKLPPVGRVVSGNEVHLLLQRNRVSVVPLNRLVEQLQRDIERRKEILLSRPFFQGTAGPVEGYVMDYIMQRQTGSLADEMRMGRGIMRVGVTGWVIKPTGDAPSESETQALVPGSRFQKALMQEGPTATITFWVYPDSFEIHRSLKAFAHDAGFWVASRPLPEGVPIAGSPQGSKSVAQ